VRVCVCVHAFVCANGYIQGATIFLLVFLATRSQSHFTHVLCTLATQSKSHFTHVLYTLATQSKSHFTRVLCTLATQSKSHFTHVLCTLAAPVALCLTLQGPLVAMDKAHALVCGWHAGDAQVCHDAMCFCLIIESRMPVFRQSILVRPPPPPFICQSPSCYHITSRLFAPCQFIPPPPPPFFFTAGVAAAAQMQAVVVDTRFRTVVSRTALWDDGKTVGDTNTPVSAVAAGASRLVGIAVGGSGIHPPYHIHLLPISQTRYPLPISIWCSMQLSGRKPQWGSRYHWG